MGEPAWRGGKVLRLPFESLETLPGGLREVRVWYDPLTEQFLVGKRLDLTMVDSNVLMEPQLLATIRHDHVVPILAAAQVDGYPAPMRVIEIVMPYYERRSVTDALLRGETFSTHEVVSLTQAALLGLGELHERHLVLHRDVKGSNLLLTDDGSRLRVGDLGLAGRMDDDGSAPALDNPQLYSPPELVKGGRWTRASDLFAKGIVLRELLVGPLPYNQYTRTEIVQRFDARPLTDTRQRSGPAAVGAAASAARHQEGNRACGVAALPDSQGYGHGTRVRSRPGLGRRRGWPMGSSLRAQARSPSSGRHRAGPQRREGRRALLPRRVAACPPDSGIAVH